MQITSEDLSEMRSIIRPRLREDLSEEQLKRLRTVLHDPMSVTGEQLKWALSPGYKPESTPISINPERLP